MARKKLVEKLVKETGYGGKGTFLVVYDFKVKGGGIPPRLYQNLKYLEDRGVVKRVQKSVLECRGLKTVQVVARLLQHYNAEYIVYKVAYRVKSFKEILLSDIARMVYSVVRKILETKNHATTGEVYEAYVEECMKLGIEPASQRWVSSILNRLGDQGLLEIKVVSLGRYGTTKIIKLPK